VEEVMTRDVVTLRARTPLKDALRTLLERNLHAAPVLDDQARARAAAPAQARRRASARSMQAEKRRLTRHRNRQGCVLGVLSLTDVAKMTAELLPQLHGLGVNTEDDDVVLLSEDVLLKLQLTSVAMRKLRKELAQRAGSIGAAGWQATPTPAKPAQPVDKDEASAQAFADRCAGIARRAATDEGRAAALADGAAAVVVTGMARHRGWMSAQAKGCEALRNLAGGAVDKPSRVVSLAVAAAGGLHAVLDAICAHPSSADVQEAACGAVRAIARAVDNKIAAGSAGVIEAVVAVMNAHGAHAGVQEQACAALASMMGFIADNQAKAGAAGAIEAIVSAMNAHGAHADLQKNACWALGNMTFNNADNEAKAGSAGAIVAVLAAMQVHGAHAGVQLYACWALRHICTTHSDLRSRARAAGAVAALDAALARFPTGNVADCANKAKEKVTAA
jgi:CBS domain-containing protein